MIKEKFKNYLLCGSILFSLFFSCKTSKNSCFKTQDLKKNGKEMIFSHKIARLSSIEPILKATKSCIGLYIFKYSYGASKLFVPVLNFGSEYYICNGVNENDILIKFESFRFNHSSAFDTTQFSEIKRRVTNGVIFVGSN